MINRVFLDKCENILPKIKNKSIDLIITDFPYFLENKSKVEIIKKNNKRYISLDKIDNWDLQWKDRENYRNWCNDILKEFYRILKDYCHCIIFINNREISYLMDYGETIGFKVRNLWCYYKTNPSPQARKVGPCQSFELALWLTKKEIKVGYYNWQLGYIHNLIDSYIPNVEGGIVRHPTQKPLKIALYLISFLSKPNDIVLDPFCGSGTFLLAAKLLKRNYIGIEIDKKYYENTIHRLNNLKDKKVIKIYNEFINEILSNKLKNINKKEILTILGKGESYGII